MNQDIERSIGFHLWLSICAVSVSITALTILGFAWLSVSDSVSDERSESDARLQAARATVERFGVSSGSASPADLNAARSLGLLRIDIFDSSGRTVRSQDFGTGTLATSTDQAAIARAFAGATTGQDARLKNGSYAVESLSWLDALRGGDFGRVTYFPLEQGNVARLLLAYDDDLTAVARSQLENAIGAGAVMICLALVATWFMLNRFVSQRLREYSALALRMAEGEPVRMPDAGRDELSSLGRALNGMADALEHQATVDALTGLYNLRHLSSNLEALIAQADATQTPVSLIVGDLDNLKPINDTFGHQAGDRLLRAVGDAVREWTGTRNACWRIGGDEFVVALPGADATDAMVKANDFRLRIASLSLQLGTTTVHAGISVGISTFPQDGETAGTLIGVADRRMYMAKTMRAEGQRLAASTPAA